MMIRALLLVVSLALPVPALAQIFVSGGMAAPLSPGSVTHVYRSGYSFALGFALESGSFPFARIRPFGSFQQFWTDPVPFAAQFDDEIEEDVDVDGGAMPVLFAGVDVQLRRPFAAFTPFVAPVLGFAVFSVEDITIDDVTFNVREETSGFAAGIGGGFAYSVSRRYGIYVEAQYVHAVLDGEDRTFVPVRLGVEFGFN